MKAEPAQCGRYLHRHTVLHQGSSGRLYQWQKNNLVGCSRAMVGGELEAEGNMFEKWGGFRESEVVHSSFSQEDSWVNQRE